MAMEAMRRATPVDLPRVVELARALRDELGTERGGAWWVRSEALAEPLSESLAEYLGSGCELLLGTYDEFAVGYAAVKYLGEGQAHGLAQITEIYVEAQARQVGVGEALIAEIVTEATQRGCRGIDATALPGTRATKNFFETMGFTARLLVMHKGLDGQPRHA